VPEAVGELRALRGGARVYPGRPRPDAAQPVSAGTPYSSKLELLSTEFVASAAEPAQFPAGDLPEIAFAGRSNVGKSSLLNALLGRKNLARVSQTPGRTRLLTFFHVTLASRGANGFPEKFLFVDLT